MCLLHKLQPGGLAYYKSWSQGKQLVWHKTTTCCFDTLLFFLQMKQTKYKVLIGVIC